MTGAYLPPPVPVVVAPSEVEERGVDKSSPELVMMATHSNVYADPTLMTFWMG